MIQFLGSKIHRISKIFLKFSVNAWIWTKFPIRISVLCNQICVFSEIRRIIVPVINLYELYAIRLIKIIIILSLKSGIERHFVFALFGKSSFILERIELRSKAWFVLRFIVCSLLIVQWSLLTLCARCYAQVWTSLNLNNWHIFSFCRTVMEYAVC